MLHLFAKATHMQPRGHHTKGCVCFVHQPALLANEAEQNVAINENTPTDHQAFASPLGARKALTCFAQE